MKVSKAYTLLSNFNIINISLKLYDLLIWRKGKFFHLEFKEALKIMTKRIITFKVIQNKIYDSFKKNLSI